MAALILLFSFLKERERLRNSRGSESARAALYFRNTIRIFANKLAFGLGAVRLMAFPIAFRFFANRLAFGLGSLAMSNAMRLFADSYALRAVEHLATFVRAFDFTFRFFAFDIANCVFRFGTGSMAFRRLADWIADCRAMRIVAFPGALGMALS